MHRKQHLWMQSEDRLSAAVEKRLKTIKENPNISEISSEKFGLFSLNRRLDLVNKANVPESDFGEFIGKLFFEIVLHYELFEFIP